jgi:hypothetical protein
MDKYNNIVQEISRLRKPKVEKNIFSIGGRGHYENPISDILAFFINPKEEHGFGLLFLQSLFDGANIEHPLLELVAFPNREQYADGNRIDLIAEGESWVLVIENKVRHDAINPFNDYMKFVTRTYKGKKPFYILLSVKEEKPPMGWRSVSWKTYIDYIKKNVGAYLTSSNNAKWHVILREFILNIENEYGDTSMIEERIEFIKNNYEDIQEMKDMLYEYIEYMTAKGMAAINSAVKQEMEVAYSKKHNWGEEGMALRLNSKDWGSNTNITLLLRRDGSLTIQIYVYDITDGEVDSLRKQIDQRKYAKYWTEPETIRCFGFFNDYNHEIVFGEISDVAHRLNEYFSTSRRKPN